MRAAWADGLGKHPPDGEEALGIPDPVREGAVDQKNPQPAGVSAGIVRISVAADEHQAAASFVKLTQ